MSAWYLVYCKPREEVRAQQNFALQTIQTYLPKIMQTKIQKGKKVIVESPLFPNYLFVRFDPKIISVSTIRSTRGVSQIVGCQETMTPLCHLVFALRQQEKQRKIIADSNQLSKNNLEEVVPLFKAGDKIVFSNGPFQDLEGVFEQKNGNKRCMVLLKILGEMKRTKVPLSSIKVAKKGNIDD